MKFQIRRATAADNEGIVTLFQEGGNPHNWSSAKWEHYYRDYPEGPTISFVAESGHGIIGHYGLFPVTIGSYQVYMGAHAYVSESVRGLAVISSLMKSLDEFCVAEQIPFIVGFANQRFTTVKTKLFKWKTPLYASFVSTGKFDPGRFQGRPFQFHYSSDWVTWRFGKSGTPVISKYQKQDGEEPVYQLLFTERKVEARDFDIGEFECWSPEDYSSEPSAVFAQPFSVKIYDKQWSGPDLLDPENWFIQMGDSDTFVFKAI
ncbi:hypothetical protein [Marinobacter alexandrii]|jgi:hypothetical protein|uniref:GNAT family N-acetyltransferase n=1 Tax=Marinobacter alexandrii TaxID=2570351 RepID=UPI002ABE3769|nr:hypothetical protein [Marinobacter alexandrii]